MNNLLSSLRAKRSNPVLFLRLWIAASLSLLAMTVSVSALAQETYSPDFCGFEVTFPAEPYVTQKCDNGDQDRCYDLVSYTKNFGLDASVKIEVICNPVGDDVYQHYSSEVMEATLRAMRDKDIIKTYETTSRDDGAFKQANLIGEGLQGVTPSLYIAQLWIDRDSAFSVEAELIGEAHTEADQLFSDILRTVRPTQAAEEQPE